MISINNTINEKVNQVIFFNAKEEINGLDLNDNERSYLNEQILSDKNDLIEINRYSHRLFFVKNVDSENATEIEKIRKTGDQIQQVLNKNKAENITVNAASDKKITLAVIEGLFLGNYQFTKYFSKEEDLRNSIENIAVNDEQVTLEDLEELNIVLDAVCFARDLVNEPIIKLNAVQFAQRVEEKAIEAGMKAEVFNKTKIESLKMGGLLAVNRGSIDPPTFTILEWKPENPVNDKPIILVGKGVVYDTGGLNIKTANYMDNMKSDMAGAAGMASVAIAIAKAKLPVHVISLLPATDNRLNGNAYASGDVITMYNGSTVEVLNTDAEGRMILADALSYAIQYDPKLVIDMATLTGAAVRALGSQVIAGMQAKAQDELNEMKESGFRVFERIVEFPLWDEYKDLLKSDIADQKNIGGAEAGTITAGKFLEAFTDYPYIHLDIAGPGYTTKKDSYRGIMGTGVGVRLLFDFIKSQIK